MLTDSNNNLILQLMSAVANTPNYHRPFLSNDQFSMNPTESLISAWIRQNKPNQLNNFFAAFFSDSDPTILPNSTVKCGYDTTHQLLQLHSLVQQQRQMMIEKQQTNVENLLRLLTTNNNTFSTTNIVNDLLAASAQRPQEFLPIKPQNFNICDLQLTVNEAISSNLPKAYNSSLSCSSTSTSRDSTPPQSAQQFSHRQEVLQHHQLHTSVDQIPIDVSGEKHVESKKLSRKRSYKDVKECDGSFPSSSSASSTTARNEPAIPSRKKIKTLKKRLMDTVTNSPVSGMFIKDNCTPDDLQKAAELDDTASYVHISEKARQNISAIPDVIGDTICALCRVKYEDVFRLAMHRCPRIIHEEYRCPECEKIFSCPANLASHRRWHRPRNSDANENDGNALRDANLNPNTSAKFSCANCMLTFTAKKAFRAHKKSCGTNIVAAQDARDDSSATIVSITDTVGGADAKTARLTDSRSLENFSAAAALISLGMSPRVCV